VHPRAQGDQPGKEIPSPPFDAERQHVVDVRGVQQRERRRGLTPRLGGRNSALTLPEATRAGRRPHVATIS
jgi:hypothetical protein